MWDESLCPTALHRNTRSITQKCGFAVQSQPLPDLSREGEEVSCLFILRQHVVPDPMVGFLMTIWLKSATWVLMTGTHHLQTRERGAILEKKMLVVSQGTIEWLIPPHQKPKWSFRLCQSRLQRSEPAVSPKLNPSSFFCLDLWQLTCFTALLLTYFWVLFWKVTQNSLRSLQRKKRKKYTHRHTRIHTPEIKPVLIFHKKSILYFFFSPIKLVRKHWKTVNSPFRRKRYIS